MFERDYLLRIIAELGAAIRRSLQQGEVERDPADAAKTLEAAVGAATELDGATLLSLAPESIASIIQVSGTDPIVTEYVARSLHLAARYHAQAGDEALAALRAAQAQAIADAYGHDLSPEECTPEAMEGLLGPEGPLGE